ncbi:hypothetical protein ABID30_001230 [Enterococcus rotai]|uniref:Uncharacterized protein n=1 Tax=Enterococcus rotai TaxID=118060 RepID=A0A0U2VML5_9ENTE|nr:hypothetical protein [Enterococcus rotai]ALS38684.1 hypothetical protein ATZ35_16465 [Enterococcus rotai]
MEKDKRYYQKLQLERDALEKRDEIFDTGSSIEIRLEIIRRLLSEDVPPEVIKRATGIKMTGILHIQRDLIDEKIKSERAKEHDTFNQFKKLELWEENSCND